MSFDRQNIFEFSRLAGQVERYHTWPTLRRQSNGEHTWQVLRIWWEMFGPPSPEETTHILWHDAGELRTGDPPFPLKATQPHLKAIYTALERLSVQEMGGPAKSALKEPALTKVKICDLIEMYEFGVVELRMGNQFATVILIDTYQAATVLAKGLPPEDQVGFRMYLNKIRKWDPIKCE